jgi:hypothetical protein
VEGVDPLAQFVGVDLIPAPPRELIFQSRQLDREFPVMSGTGELSDATSLRFC